MKIVEYALIQCYYRILQKKKLLQTMQAKTQDTHLSILFVRATKIEMPGVHCHSACQPIEELATEPAAVVACMICDSPSIPAMLDMIDDGSLLSRARE